MELLVAKPSRMRSSTPCWSGTGNLRRGTRHRRGQGVTVGAVPAARRLDPVQLQDRRRLGQRGGLRLRQGGLDDRREARRHLLAGAGAGAEPTRPCPLSGTHRVHARRCLTTAAEPLARRPVAAACRGPARTRSGRRGCARRSRAWAGWAWTSSSGRPRSPGGAVPVPRPGRQPGPPVGSAWILMLRPCLTIGTGERSPGC